MKLIDIAGLSDKGRQRTDNQDAFVCEGLWTDHIALLAVIDGVGGYAGGEKAAAIARTSIRNYMKSPKGDTLTMLREAVVFANNQIALQRQQNDAFAEMCCVITAVVADVKKAKCYYVHVGDTRLYRYSREGLLKITKDHSLVGVREDAGELSEVEAMRHPQRNIILREIGSTQHRLDDEDFLDYGETAFLPGDMLLLCSDGLSDMVDAGEITASLLAPGNPEKRIRSLIAKANEMGGKDNITVVIAKNNAVSLNGHRKKPVVPHASNVNKPTPATTATAKEKSSSTTIATKKKSNGSLWVLFLLLAGAAGFFFTRPVTSVDHASAANAQNSLLTKDSTTGIRPADSSAATIVEGTVASVQTEPAVVPVRLAHSLSLTTMLHDHPDAARILFELQQPARHSDSTALVITKADSALLTNDTLTLRNKTFKDFKVGIRLQRPVFLKLENVVFQNVKYPFYYDFKKDSAHLSTLKL